MPDTPFEDYDSCWRCGGQGWVVRCVDDMCHGAGSCLHEDGNVQCPECEMPPDLWDYSGMVVWEA